jgi:hypothetical protein
MWRRQVGAAFGGRFFGCLGGVFFAIEGGADELGGLVLVALVLSITKTPS